MEKGVSNSDVRTENKKNLIRLLYRHPGMSKQDIALHMKLSIPTINLLVSQLEESQLLERRRANSSPGGRIPDLLFFKYDAKVVVGVEILPHMCTILVTDLAGHRHAKRCILANYNDGITYWQGLRAIILQETAAYNFRHEDILGIGVALDPKVAEYPMARQIMKNCKKPHTRSDELMDFHLLVDLNSNSAGFATIWMDKNFDNAVYLSISDQISGSIIIDRQILQGIPNHAGKLGHIVINSGTEVCSCGRKGCAQTCCSTTVLTKIANGDLDQFFSLLPQSMVFAKAWDSYTDNLASFIVNINLMTSLPVIIGGEISKYLEQFGVELRRKIAEKDPFYSGESLFCTTVIEDAAATGAALMIAARYLGLLDKSVQDDSLQPIVYRRET